MSSDAIRSRGIVTQPHPSREAERNPFRRTRYAYESPHSCRMRTRLAAAPEGSRENMLDGSAGWNRLPAGVALRYVRVIACRIGAIVPGLAGVRLAVAVIVVIRIIAPVRIIIIGPRQSGAGQPPAVASAVPAMVPVPRALAGKAVVQAREATVETAAVEPAGVEAAAMKPAKPSAMESAPAVKTATTAVPAAAAAPMGVGDIWLAENSCTQQRGCHAHQTPRFPGPGSVIA